MKRIIALVLSLMIIALMICVSSCDDFFDALNSALENLDVTDGEYSDNNIQTETESTETEMNVIPFKYAPEIVYYTMPTEVFKDDLEREASQIIDEAVRKAVSYVNAMKDERHSKIEYAYEYDPNGYIGDLNSEEVRIFNMLADAGRDFNDIEINETDVKTDLNQAYFNLHKPLTFTDPVLVSYFGIQAKIYLDDKYVTHTKKIYSEYHDPYGDFTNVISSTSEKQKLKHDIALLERIVQRVVRFMPDNLSTYDRYYYLAAVLSEHVTYTPRPANSDTAFGALVCGKAVCEGYASAYMLLCREANLYCAYRTGQPDGMHIWNMVRLESGIYNVDVTWCDITDSYKEKWYEYFMKSDDDFSDHNITTGVMGTGSYEPSPYEN